MASNKPMLSAVTHWLQLWSELSVSVKSLYLALPLWPLGEIIQSAVHQFTQLYEWEPGCRQWWEVI